MRRCKLLESSFLLLTMTLLLVLCAFLPALVHTQNVRAALGLDNKATPTLIVKTIDGNLHYVRLDDRLTRLWSIDLGQLISSNLEDAKVS